jgi:flagellar biosynthetic protein FliR
MIVLQEEIVMGQLAAFLLLAVRIGALFAAAPVLSASAVSLPIRIGLTMAITLTLLGKVSVPEVDLMSPPGVMTLVREVLIGLSIGLLFQLAFAAVAMAGEQIAFAMGLGFASMVDPQTGSPSPVLTQFMSILLILIFLITEGHHVLLRQLAASYEALPIGAEFSTDMFLGIAKAATLVFSAALLIAAPAIVLLFLVNLLIGFMTRVAPQMNIFSVGFPVTILAGFAVLLVSIPTLGNGMSNLLQSVAGIVRDLVLARGSPA